jgi:hypothetical protein
MSDIEHSDDSGPIFVRLDGVYFQRCSVLPVPQPRRNVAEVVPVNREQGAVSTDEHWTIWLNHETRAYETSSVAPGSGWERVEVVRAR